MKDSTMMLFDAIQFRNMRGAEEFYCFATSYPRNFEGSLDPSILASLLSLEYLLLCVGNKTECGSDEGDDNLSRAEALWEMYRPFEKFSKADDSGRLFDLYWGRIEDFLRASSFMPDFSTHFLESVFSSPRERKRMKGWRYDEKLEPYLRDLEENMQL